jgi:2-polyprenyl-6-methoxyphenol hydroxylase-like FAD-dependent oxidoreductase
MPKVAVIGAGQAGLLAAHGLHQRGCEVVLYSDRSPEDFLEKARPTGTAARFQHSLDWERELGLEHWFDVAPKGEGVHLHFCPGEDVTNILLTLQGRLTDPFLAIDVRLQSATWMRELDEAGASIEVEHVTLERLDEIAAQHDLTLVAGGRGDVVKLFARDEARSTWTKPQRALAMVNVTGIPMTMPYAPQFTPVKFNFTPVYGECFWVPWYSKGGQQSWSLVFEGQPGGPIDSFQGIEDVEAALEHGKDIIRRFAPWDYEWVRDSEPCDDNSWIVGTFTPEVRHVVGTLPSGRTVMALGDTAHSLDPIGGQGANNGSNMSKVFVDAIVERGDGPFDADWMRATFDRFWERWQWRERFNNTLLVPLTKAGKLLLVSTYGSTAREDDVSPQQRLADAFIDNFDDPAVLTPGFHDEDEAKRILKETFGSSTRPYLRGMAKIARGQLRHKLGRDQGHPGTLPFTRP